MTFTESLRKENQDVYEAIFNHPFVQGIGEGNVPRKALAHYIKADFEYLNAFMYIYGIAISKSSTRKEVNFFNKQVDFVLNSEIHPHHNFCEQIGVSYEELQGYPLPPSADHYVKHMMYHAHTGSLGELIAALLPCPWTYLEIGRELLRSYQPAQDHPFYEWISFYATDEVEEITMQLRKMLDKLAADAGEAELKRIKSAFRKSCQLELSFWEMAYTCQEWPVSNSVTV
ncbi:thiaminase II [Virgibacillus flavescens]|uniref:thiaminase II n=1 Tax=Virgibacillus flavescens TaxID=1611422 RepID=UPI003D328BA3